MEKIINRKGSISTTSLLFVAIILIIMAWTSFIFSNSDNQVKSESISNTLSQVEFTQKYILAESASIAKQVVLSKTSDSELKNTYIQDSLAHKLGIEEEGNLFAKIKNGDFSFSKDGEQYVLQVNEVGFESKGPDADIKRTFDINLRFDKDGNLAT